VIEYRGKVFEQMSVESRLTVCNMSIEGGARAGLIAPDDVTFAYLEGRPLAPKGEEWDRAVAYWRTLKTDEGAVFDKSVVIDASAVEPTVTWARAPRTRSRSAAWCPIRRVSPTLRSKRPRVPASTTWGSSPASGWTRSKCRTCSSAAAPTAA
jgi:homoaconitase/3-isopropylmalate dehydratase large subunit